MICQWKNSMRRMDEVKVFVHLEVQVFSLFTYAIIGISWLLLFLALSIHASRHHFIEICHTSAKPDFKMSCWMNGQDGGLRRTGMLGIGDSPAYIALNLSCKPLWTSASTLSLCLSVPSFSLSLSHQEWFTVYEHNRRPSCTVSDLVMGNEYSFRVFSENICGLSDESGISKNTAVITKTGNEIPAEHCVL